MNRAAFLLLTVGAALFVGLLAWNEFLLPVVLGSEAGGRTEILAGVAAGDTVVTSPAPALTDGAPVAGGTTTGAGR